MDSVVTPCKEAPAVMCQEHERECEHLCHMESSGRTSSFLVKSRDPGAKGHSNLVLYLFLGKGN